MNRTYIAIDLKSFYASVECRERGLDPLDTNLVVADESRTDKTICLAVTPSLKSYGIPGRARLFEVKQRVKEVNSGRKHDTNHNQFQGSSYIYSELQNNPNLSVDYIIAPPRMAYYMEYSTRIYKIYLKYISSESIVVYSIDEVFIDVTDYLSTYKLTASELAMKMIQDVLHTTGITATVGVGSNLFLCKIAMDIVAKHMPADSNGVRISELDEQSYRRTLWSHQPLTDFWRVGRSYAKKLEEYGMFTMGDIARKSLNDEALLYKLFGKNAELLIDHAWGWEPCTIEHIKKYKPSAKSIGSGQVLHRPYKFNEVGLVLQEMAEALALDICAKNLLTKQIVITIHYDIENIIDSEHKINYTGPIVKDGYGRSIPKYSHGTINLKNYTSSATVIMNESLKLYNSIANKKLLIRKLNITANNVISVMEENNKLHYEQLDFFTSYETLNAEINKNKAKLAKEQNLQKTVISIKNRFGKNSIFRAISLEDAATAIDRNSQIGGHKA